MRFLSLYVLIVLCVLVVLLLTQISWYLPVVFSILFCIIMFFLNKKQKSKPEEKRKAKRGSIVTDEDWEAWKRKIGVKEQKTLKELKEEVERNLDLIATKEFQSSQIEMPRPGVSDAEWEAWKRKHGITRDGTKPDYDEWFRRLMQKWGGGKVKTFKRKTLRKNKKAISQIMTTVLLLILAISVGSIIYMIYSGQLQSIGGGFINQLIVGANRAGELPDLLFYVKNDTHTTLYIYNYGFTDITPYQVNTPANSYNASQITLLDHSGSTVTQIKAGELTELLIPENATKVQLISTNGGVWTWQTP